MQDGVGVYLNDIVQKRPLMIHDKYYSGIVSLPFPANTLLIPFWILYCFVKNKSYNKCVMLASFLLIALVQQAIFFCFCLVSLIPTYLKVVASKLYFIKRKLTKTSRKERVG